MLALLCVFLIVVFGYHLMAAMIYFGLTIMKALATISAFFLITMFLISAYGIVMLPIIAFVCGVMLLSAVCRRLLHRERITIRL